MKQILHALLVVALLVWLPHVSTGAQPTPTTTASETTAPATNGAASAPVATPGATTAPTTLATAPTTAPTTAPAVASSQPAPVGNTINPPELLIHGSSRRFWIARVLPAARATPGMPNSDLSAESGVHTELYSRTDGGTDWSRLSVIPNRVVDMAHRGDQLAILLEDGSWTLVSPEEGVVSGAALAGGGRIRAIANDEHTLWALADIPGGASAATHAAAQAATTLPARGSATLPSG